jgi:hypothetical protein
MIAAHILQHFKMHYQTLTTSTRRIMEEHQMNTKMSLHSLKPNYHQPQNRVKKRMRK